MPPSLLVVAPTFPPEPFAGDTGKQLTAPHTIRRSHRKPLEMSKLQIPSGQAPKGLQGSAQGFLPSRAYHLHEMSKLQCTACLATIVLSLWDKNHAPIEGPRILKKHSGGRFAYRLRPMLST
jgi:hypothetical protein